MLKRLFTAAILSFSAGAFAQAPLPTSYNFEGFAGQSSLSAGWTTNITGTYTYTTGQSGVSGKIDLQGEYIGVQTNDPMGVVTYYLKGSTSNGAAWQGTFTLEESTNGSNWTALTTFSNNLNANNFVQYTANPNAASRYIRWFFTAKSSGSNVAIDEISIAQAVVTSQEINVKQNGSTIFSGGTSAPFSSNVSTPLTVNFTVENQGTQQSLSLSGVNFSGPAASDFSVSSPSFPATVSPSGNTTLAVTFTPSAAGTRSAVMTIANNDADEGSYVINLFGVGGEYATEPAAQATGLSFSNVKAYRYTANFTAASSAPTGYLVLRKIGSAVTETPVDGTFYTRGDAIGGAKVVSVGSATSVVPTYNVANTDYYFAVYAYNGTGAVVNYLQSNPLTGSVTTTGANPGSYYNGVDPSASTFVNDLQAVINPHTSIFYGNYDETMVRLFSSRDTTNGQKVVTCVYSGLNQVYSEPFDWTTADFSREHTYCHDWMPTNPADNPELPEYNDQHHIFPAKFTDVNETRSNLPLDNVATVVSTFQDATYGKNSSGKNVFEPRDSHKGDAARALFYMCAAYNGESGNSWTLPHAAIYENQNVLRQWHFQDPPDAWEIARNEFLDSLQGNRNPFIDNPDWVCHIDFFTMNYIANPGTAPCEFTDVETPSLLDNQLAVFPNPSKAFLNISLNVDQYQPVQIQLCDLLGKVVLQGNYKASKGNNQYSFNTENLTPGQYLVKITSGDSAIVKNWIKE
ncbi:MAG: endonuclease [Bacteroidia bacterium]|nr:endonuclease [Bacteroidia bacterium]